MAELWPKTCPICSADVTVPPLVMPGDAACPGCGHVFWFLRRDEQGIAILEALSGKISINQDIARVSGALQPETGPPRVVLNLSRLQLVSSSFMAGLIALHKSVSAAGGKLILCGLSTVVRETLNGAKLDRLLNIESTEQAALDSF